MIANKTNKFPFYYYLFALLIPVLFLLLLELGLRIGGYGQPVVQWISPSEKFPDYMILNPDIAKRYFKNTAGMPRPNYDGFKKIKPDSTFRLFVMGGSSAAGFPFPVSGAFSRYVRRYLEARFPGADIEVVNLALSAVNTFTLRDLLPGMIEQKPDLVLFYTGHNEYYGALGAGSAEFLGGSPELVYLLFKLRSIRVYQLMEDIIDGASGLFADAPDTRTDRTLMARMVGEQTIPLHSELYNNGIRQFNLNMHAILSELEKNNIPFILATVTANLRDQHPFISVAIDSLPAADDIFRRAQQGLAAGTTDLAARLFMRAKELDALRFRAPQAINSIILQLAGEYAAPLVNVDSLFSVRSPAGITGDNLTVDHVHPTVEGQQLIGAAFADMMEAHGLLPNVHAARSIDAAHHTARQTLSLTELDTISAAIRMRYLKGGWPFTDKDQPNLSLTNFQPSTPIEELALQWFKGEINWELAHVRAASYYRSSGQADAFEAEMRTLIENAPFNDAPYKIMVDGLLEFQRFDRAYPYLAGLHQLKPDAFTYKWLGTYYLYKEEINPARNYLEQAAELAPQDAQLFYNLSGVYIYLKEYEKALQTVERCLQINPAYPAARRTRDDLLRKLGRN